MLDIYEDAAEEGVVFTGGSAQTVGAAGGYMTGGGHSPFSHFYGLAVDSELYPPLGCCVYPGIDTP